MLKVFGSLVALLTVVGLSGCTSDDNTLTYELSVYNVGSSEYGYFYGIDDLKEKNGDLVGEGEAVIIMGSGSFDVWNGDPSSQTAYVTVNNQPLKEEEVNFFQDGTGAPGAHHLVITQNEESSFYEIIDIEWANQVELDEERSTFTEAFDGETPVEVKELVLNGEDFEGHTLEGKTLRYPAVLGELTLEDVYTIYGGGKYVHGSLDFQYNQTIEWNFFESIGESYFVFSVPDEGQAIVYLLEGDVVSPILTLEDSENFFSYFLQTSFVQTAKGESYTMVSVYQYREEEGQPQEFYFPHRKEWVLVNPNSEYLLDCYAEVTLEYDQEINTMQFMNREDCEEGQPGVYLNGERVADSFIPSTSDSPYMGDAFLSPDLKTVAFAVELADATDYLVVWTLASDSWEVYDILPTDPENDYWGYGWSVDWTEKADSSYAIVLEKTDYTLRALAI